MPLLTPPPLPASWQGHTASLHRGRPGTASQTVPTGPSVPSHRRLYPKYFADTPTCGSAPPARAAAPVRRPAEAAHCRCSLSAMPCPAASPAQRNSQGRSSGAWMAASMPPSAVRPVSRFQRRRSNPWQGGKRQPLPRPIPMLENG